MLGLPQGEVFLVPWTAEWEQEFLDEKTRIGKEIGSGIKNIYHIGSTAVKGLKAKPIIDIAIELQDFQTGYDSVQGLEKIGYAYKGTNILPDRHYFSKGEPRTHQIHMYGTGSPHLLRQLAFRDHLNQHAEARRNYEQLKEMLANAHHKDKLAYADAKTEFIHTILDHLHYRRL